MKGFEKKPKLNRRLFSVFVIGIFVGALGASWQLGQDLEKLYLNKVQLERENQDLNKHNEVLTEKMKEMEENIAQREKIKVENIDLKIELTEHDEFLELGLEKHIKKELEETVLNREVQALDPLVIHALYHNRLISWDQHLYRLSVKTLLISEDFILALRIKKEVLTKN